jgi:hypothetical protein
MILRTRLASKLKHVSVKPDVRVNHSSDPAPIGETIIVKRDHRELARVIQVASSVNEHVTPYDVFLSHPLPRFTLGTNIFVS